MIKTNFVFFLFSNTGNVSRAAISDLERRQEVGIGEWCVFKVESRLLVGMILSFCYTAGKSFKSRQYTKQTANITSAVPIGVLAAWYTWNNEGKLMPQSLKSHTYIGIENYKTTIPKPSYKQKELRVNVNVLQQLIVLQ